MSIYRFRLNSFFLAALAGMVMGGCTLSDPTRVQEDFGKSVRLMVAEQIYDPATAHEPQEFGPTALGGDVANSTVEGYTAASREARRERQVTEGSPLPIVGTVQQSE